jgi:hypothetical protein
MAAAKPDLRALFCEALERKSPDELARYLDAACGDDADLRAQVEQLLAAHREGPARKSVCCSNQGSAAPAWRCKARVSTIVAAQPIECRAAFSSS